MAIRKLLAYAAIYVLWGASFLAIRQVVAVTPPFFAASFRFLCAGGILFIFSLAQGVPKPVNRQQWISTAVLGLIMFAGPYLPLPGGREGSALGTCGCDRGHHSGLGSCWGTVVCRFATADGEVPGWRRPRRCRCLVLLMLPAGIHGSGFTLSALILLTGCFLWASGTVATRHLQLPKQAQHEFGPANGLGRRISSSISAATGEMGKLPALSHRWDWHIGFAMVYLIIFASIIAFTAYVYLIARDPASCVASYAYVNPLIALLLGSLLAGDSGLRLSNTREPPW